MSFENNLKEARLKKKWTQAELAAASGVSQSAIGNYEKGNRTPTYQSMMKLSKALNVSIDMLNFGYPRTKEQMKKLHNAVMDLNNTVKPAEPGSMREVPVISFAQAAGYEPALEPVDDYCENCSSHSAVFANEVKPGYFALTVDGDSMSPKFPHGSNLLVAGGEFPQRGDIVVAKLRNGQVVCKIYNRRQNTIELCSINPDGKCFEWHCKEDPGYIQWMYPVIEANINLRQQRWEKRKG